MSALFVGIRKKIFLHKIANSVNEDKELKFSSKFPKLVLF